MTRVRDNQIGYVAFAAALLMLVAGCQENKPAGKSYGTDDFFPTAGPHRSTSQFKQVQAASGARADSTLRDVHFDGGEINSLGRSKLELMLVDDQPISQLKVYVVGDETDLAARRASVATFLGDKGLTGSQIAIVDGENPGSFHAVAPDLVNMPKTDSGVVADSTEAGSADVSASEPAMIEE